jgi:NADH-quinone oxidoreductase subunit N
MNLHDLVSQLILDTKGTPGPLWSAPSPDSSLAAFFPELAICLTILALLALRVPRWGWRIDSFWIALLGTLVALYAAAPWQLLPPLAAQATSQIATPPRMEIFTGMLVYDPFAIFVRSLLLAFAVLLVLLTRLTGIHDREDAVDIYALFLGATLGMCLMASANHLLTVFLSVEMASVPSYALAGLLKGRRQASEAALKYSVYGAGAAGVMLYGISLLAGLLHTAHLPTLAAQLATKLAQPLPASELMVLVLAGLMIAVGLAFKLSAVPFHFWCPDVFEGATAEVDAFLSIASKGAALALLVRVALGISTIPPEGVQPGQRATRPATAAVFDFSSQLPHLSRFSHSTHSLHSLVSTSDPQSTQSSLFNVQQETPQAGAGAVPPAESAAAEPAGAVAAAGPESQAATAMDALAPVRRAAARLIALFAIVTCTFGNLAAYGQNNLKRLLAYSTIAHAGYLLMPVSAAVAMAGLDRTGAEQAIAALGVYLVVYLFMNLVAFAVVALLRNALRSEDVTDYAGLIRRMPLTVVCLAVTLFSLIGLPPLSGFIGKFAIFAALVDAFQTVESAGQAGFYLLLMLVVGGINTAISLFYYLRVVKIMTMDPEPRDRVPVPYSDVSLPGAFLWVMTLPTALLIVSWDWLSQLTQAAARHLFS